MKQPRSAAEHRGELAMRLATVLCGFAAAMLTQAADAAIVTQTLDFTGSNFTLSFGDSSVAPIDPASIAATITLDDTLVYDMATAGLTFASNLPYPATFAYDPTTDILTLATFADPDSCPNPPGSFCVFVSSFSTTPNVFFFQQSTPTGGYYVAQTITPGADLGGVPEPAAWAMLIAGFGTIGAALRQRRKMTVAYA